MFRLLKPMGRLLNHQITISHDKPHGKPGTDRFLDRYIFPDGDLGAPGFIESCIHDAGFNVVHQENLRQHYALTPASLEPEPLRALGRRGQAGRL